MSTEFEIDPRAAEYYQRPTYTLDSELQIARERIDEWSYEEDPHGYCHDRSGWVALVNGVETLRARLAEVEAERDDAMAGVREWKHSSDVHLAAAEAWRPVVEAARASVAAVLELAAGRRDSTWLSDHTKVLIAAVDALPSTPHGGDRPDGSGS